MPICNNCRQRKKVADIRKVDGVCHECNNHPLFDSSKPKPPERYNPWPARYKALSLHYFGSSNHNLSK